MVGLTDLSHSHLSGARVFCAVIGHVALHANRRLEPFTVPPFCCLGGTSLFHPYLKLFHID